MEASPITVESLAGTSRVVMRDPRRAMRAAVLVREDVLAAMTPGMSKRAQGMKREREVEARTRVLGVTDGDGGKRRSI